jgi:hypothetical protein
MMKSGVKPPQKRMISSNRDIAPAWLAWLRNFYKRLKLKQLPSIYIAYNMNHCKLIFSLFVGFCLFSANAFGQQWYYAMTGASGDVFLADIEKLQTDGDYVRVWVRVDLKTPKWTEGTSRKKVTKELVRWVFNCKSSRFAVIAKNSQGEHGELVDSLDWSTRTPSFSEIAPGTVGDGIGKFVCGIGKKFADGSLKPAVPEWIFGEKWTRVTADSDDNAIYIVADRITAGKNDNANLTFYYQKRSYKNPTYSGLSLAYGTIQVWAADCANRQLDDFGGLTYGVNNSVLYRYAGSTSPPLKVKEGTVGATTLEFVCGFPRSEASTGGGDSRTKPSEPSKTSSSGTAWYSESGYFVTAYHVVAGAKTVSIAGHDKQPIVATIVAADSKNDVALLSADLKGKSLRPIPFAKGVAALGSRVFTVGYPHSDYLGVSPKITSGEISGALPLDPTKILISVPVQAGNSGGPLLNMSGEAVGMVIEKLRADKMLANTGDLTENTNFALKAKYIQALLEDQPKLKVVNILTKPKSMALEELVGMYKDSVVFVFTTGASVK